jgi:DNA repair exonuclease SbcCD nuclease subunit
MRILQISDVHADARLYGASRFDEVERAVIESVRVAIARGVDRWQFLGDLCDPDSGAPVFRCVRLALDAAYSLARAGIPSDWLAGNHDVVEDGSGDTVLTPLRALQAGGMPVHVHERPGWTQLGRDRHLLVLPYTATSHTYDPAAFVRDTWAGGSGNGLRAGEVHVVTHLSIEGVQPGEETKDMPRGRDVLYPAGLIASLRPRSQSAGHFHKRQVYKGIQIVGAPARFAFGERDNDPGFLIVEV